MTEFILPDLPYDYAALEPHISARIMQLHHDKHHLAYVKGANQALVLPCGSAGSCGAVAIPFDVSLIVRVTPAALAHLLAQLCGTLWDQADQSAFQIARTRRGGNAKRKLT